MCESILNCFFSSCARLQLLTWKLPNEDNARFCLDSVVQHSLVFTCLSFERLHRFLFCSKQKHGCRSRLRRFHVQRSYNRRSDVVFPSLFRRVSLHLVQHPYNQQHPELSAKRRKQEHQAPSTGSNSRASLLRFGHRLSYWGKVFFLIFNSHSFCILLTETVLEVS